jgi:hypothetical protein
MDRLLLCSQAVLLCNQLQFSLSVLLAQNFFPYSIKTLLQRLTGQIAKAEPLIEWQAEQ